MGLLEEVPVGLVVDGNGRGRADRYWVTSGTELH